MAIAARQAVTVGTNATRLDQAASDQFPGASLLLVAQAAGTLILGPVGVTAANGARFPVVTGTVIPVELQDGESLYGVVASGSLVVDVLLGSA